MHEVTASPDPELDVIWRERPVPPKETKRKDYRLLKSRITNLVLLGIICIMAVVIWVLQAGPI
ncbi:MAG TPA: hypothetical protein H9695_13615 [Candidatus Mediterraneibacter excrementigallinarum]|nr:hypothetical protein [Candidatus Mediterraneibacter excrementigallinarum]